VAVDTDNGLVVPVIRDVDGKGIFELARELAELAERARARRLGPGDMQGACFTISSLGGIGGTAFTPIVNVPEVAILGLSKLRVQPRWSGGTDAGAGGAFEGRAVLPLSLSYDHRVIDGAAAARFTTRLAQILAHPAHLLL
jgi:pyruvate dehydrogenase E2 component (dihydrolipoamide acetyltransferase)